MKRTLSLNQTKVEELNIPRRTCSNPIGHEESSISSPVSAQQPCVMCFERPSDAVVMECGHGGLCYECSLEMWKNIGHCHMCRGEISQVLQVEKMKNELILVKSTTHAVYYEQK